MISSDWEFNMYFYRTILILMAFISLLFGDAIEDTLPYANKTSIINVHKFRTSNPLGRKYDPEDWTVVIQDAINTLDQNKGGVIFFPAGIYLISGTIYCYNTEKNQPIECLTLKGIGISGANEITGSSLERRTRGTTLLKKNKGDIIRINIKPDGTWLSEKSGRTAVIDGINFVGSKNARVCAIRGFRCYSPQITNCNFIWFSVAINFNDEIKGTGNYTDRIIINNVNIQGVSEAGIMIRKADASSISRVYINHFKTTSLNNAAPVGISINGGSGIFMDNIIVNHCPANGTCIYLSGVKDVKLSGMHFENNVSSFIYHIKESHNVSIDGSASHLSYQALLKLQKSFNVELLNHTSQTRKTPPPANYKDIILGSPAQKTYNITLRNIVILDLEGNSIALKKDAALKSVAVLNSDVNRSDIDFLNLKEGERTLFNVDKAGNITGGALEARDFIKGRFKTIENDTGRTASKIKIAAQDSGFYQLDFKDGLLINIQYFTK